jgi:hypothetical protein
MGKKLGYITALSIAAAVTIAVAPVVGPDSDHAPVCAGDQIAGIDGCVEGRPGAVGAGVAYRGGWVTAQRSSTG